MNKTQVRFLAAGIGSLLVLPTAAALVVSGLIRDLHRIDASQVAAAASAHPAFTVERRLAALRAIRTQQHPQWQQLSPTARAERLAAFAALWLRQKSPASAAPALAHFRGNGTFIFNTSGNALALRRMPDCSLTLYTGGYSIDGSSATAQIAQAMPHYEQALHTGAGLTTQADVFAGGCTDPSLGLGSRRAAYLGTLANGGSLGAGSGFNPPHQANALYYGALNLDSTDPQTGSGADFSLPGLVGIAAGDLNGDGLADVVGLDAASGDIEVWLTQSDGTFAAPAHYALGGSTTEGAVIADVNGDGKPDVVVATRDTSIHEQLWVLTGDGTGALHLEAPQSLPTPRNSVNEVAYIGTMAAADVRGSGHDDLIGANGLVLLNDGTGTFTPAAQPAFTTSVGTSNFGPNVAVGDFNKDGKLDLAVDDGESIHIYLGNGDGTFTPGPAYASDSDVGYLTATDLDGDGNPDLYVGLANGGVFGGDQFGPNQAYALMGNGDGTFSGAPYTSFTYTGENLADFNGDGHLDAVGVNADYSFTSYLGDGKGDFVAKSTLQTSPFSYNGAQYPFDGIDSYAIADVDGDGHPDLVFLATGLVVRPPVGFDTPGFLVARGDGQGGFAAPTFIGSGHFVPGNDIDNNPTIMGLRLGDVNHDGKTDLVFSYSDEDYTTGTNYLGIAVQLGNGDGTFQGPQTLVLSNTTGTYHVIDIADLNNDGNPDLVLTTSTLDGSGNPLNGIEVALGKGDGTFGTPIPVTTTDVVPVVVINGTYAPIVVADMNGDGIPDIVALGEATGGSMQIAIALGNGDGTFKAPNKTTFGNSYGVEGLAVADFNGDGKLDVAIAGAQTPIDTGIVFGNGDGTLQPLAGPAGLGPNEVFYLNMWGAAVAADLDGDGKPDLLAGQTVLLNLGSASSSSSSSSSTSSSSSSSTSSSSSSSSASSSSPPAGGSSSSSSTAASGGGGGAIDPWTLLALFGLLAAGRRRSRRAAPAD